MLLHFAYFPVNSPTQMTMCALNRPTAEISWLSWGCVAHNTYYHTLNPINRQCFDEHDLPLIFVLRNDDLLPSSQPSGAGKTSFLKILTLDKMGGQISGQVTFNGHKVRKIHQSRNSLWKQIDFQHAHNHTSGGRLRRSACAST